MHKTISRSSALAGVLAVGAISAPALAAGPPASTPHSTNNHATAYVPAGTPNGTANPGTSRRRSMPSASASAKAKGRAYGRYCADQSKKRVEGEKGSSFSRCVRAGAKVLKNHDAADRPTG